jgi:hypothetical protein
VRNIPALSAHDAYIAFDRYFERVAGLMKSLLFVIRRTCASVTSGWLRDGEGPSFQRSRRARMVRLFTMSAADLLDEWFDDPRVKGRWPRRRSSAAGAAP